MSAFNAELNIHALEKLPLAYSNAAVEWLLSDFDRNALEDTSGEKTESSACQRVLTKFSACCSDEMNCLNGLKK